MLKFLALKETCFFPCKKNFSIFFWLFSRYTMQYVLGISACLWPTYLFKPAWIVLKIWPHPPTFCWRNIWIIFSHFQIDHFNFLRNDFYKQRYFVIQMFLSNDGNHETLMMRYFVPSHCTLSFMCNYFFYKFLKLKYTSACVLLDRVSLENKQKQLFLQEIWQTVVSCW